MAKTISVWSWSKWKFKEYTGFVHFYGSKIQPFPDCLSWNSRLYYELAKDEKCTLPLLLFKKLAWLFKVWKKAKWNSRLFKLFPATVWTPSTPVCAWLSKSYIFMHKIRVNKSSLFSVVFFYSRYKMAKKGRCWSY